MKPSPSSQYGTVSPLPPWPEVWIIGGGKSVKQFDMRRLLGKRVLFLNGHCFPSFANLEVEPILFSLDNRWVGLHRRFIEDFPGEKYIALPLETWPDCGNIPGVTYLRWGYERMLSEDPAIICTGTNSGYAGINLCTLKGAKEIHLIGYDMNPLDGAEYEWWAPMFKDMLPQLYRSGTKVYNHNPESFIGAFPFMV